LILGHCLISHNKRLNYNLQSTIYNLLNEVIVDHVSPVEFYITKLQQGISILATVFYPKKVIVRMSDFKSNEYKNLVGGEYHEPDQ